MCDPISISLAVATAAASGVAAADSAKKQNQYESLQQQAQQQAMAMNKSNAQQAYADNVRAEGNRNLEQQVASAQQNQEASLQQMKASSALATSLGSAGVGGLSIDTLFADYDKQKAMLDQANAYNNQVAQLQSNERVAGYGTDYQNRVNSLQPYIKRPVANNVLSETLNGAAAGYSLGSSINGGIAANKNTKALKKLGGNP